MLSERTQRPSAPNSAPSSKLRPVGSARSASAASALEEDNELIGPMLSASRSSKARSGPLPSHVLECSAMRMRKDAKLERIGRVPLFARCSKRELSQIGTL